MGPTGSAPQGSPSVVLVVPPRVVVVTGAEDDDVLLDVVAVDVELVVDVEPRPMQRRRSG